MIFTEVGGTECTQSGCNGTLAYGFQERASGWKAYCDCTECHTEYGSTFISYSDVDDEDEKHEQARKHVQRCSA